MPHTQIDSGALEGEWSSDGVTGAFKGIPYARPPVGDLRWRAPQRLEPWSGTRSAVQFGSPSVQPRTPESSFLYNGELEGSEDCLYLNVYTGSLDRSERRPVIVWFHFGGFSFGWSGGRLFDGSGLARAGAVVVTVNYRLGRLGFLAHPALTAESPANASGNYGLMDQIAALAWVRENIAAFGGDPDCVTIYGVSAGSLSVSALMASPLAKGLFHRAIGGSGGAFGPVSEDSTRMGDYGQSLAAAERTGERLMLGFDARTAQQLRDIPARQLLTVDFSNPVAGYFDSAYPIVDGHVLPADPYSLFTSGQFNDVPLITGSNTNEFAPFIADAELYKQVNRELLGSSYEHFIALFPDGDVARTIRSCIDSNADRLFTWQNWTWAGLQSRHGTQPAFYYHFAHESPIPEGRYAEQALFPLLGAIHASEIPYVFRNLAARDWPWREADRELSETLSRYWLNFARTGDPNGPGCPAWPRFTTTDPLLIRFDRSATVEAAPVSNLRERMAFWDGFYSRERASRPDLPLPVQKESIT